MLIIKRGVSSFYIPQCLATGPSYPPYSAGRQAFGTCRCSSSTSEPWMCIWEICC